MPKQLKFPLSDAEVEKFIRDFELWQDKPIDELSYLEYVPSNKKMPNFYRYLDEYFDQFSIGGRNGTVFVRGIDQIESDFDSEIGTLNELQGIIDEGLDAYVGDEMDEEECDDIW